MFSGISRRTIRNKYIKETLRIVHQAKIPKKLPKVVYVYTVHNDFMPARLLQNMKQTYKNFEVWISDGSDNTEIIREVNNFAQKHKIRLYRLGGKGSISKSDNLNHFLQYSGAHFDYLMIGDADEIFDKYFVECNIRFFYSDKFEKLAFVSPLNQCYKTQGLYTNIMRNIDNITMFNRDLIKSVQLRDYSNLYSASCLISSKFIQSMNGKFPDSVLEDYYSENIAVMNGWIGIVSGLTVCTQAYDVTIKAHYARVMRILDWIIKLRKHDPFKDYNEKYSRWFMRSFVLIILPLLLMIGFIALTVTIWLIVINWTILINDTFFICTICIGIGFIIISSLIANYDTSKIIKFSNGILLFIFTILYSLSFISYMCKHWILTICFNKYSNFLTGTQKRFLKNKLSSVFKKILPDILMLLLFGFFLFVFNWLFYEFLFPLTNLSLVFFILGNLILGIFTLSLFSTIVLYMFSLIKINRYDPNKPIYFKNNYVASTEIKDKFYSQHSDLKRIC